MFTTIAKLFGKSPFTPLKAHLKKVELCIKELNKSFKSYRKKKSTRYSYYSKKNIQIRTRSRSDKK